jgi:N-acetylmuramic acid 6-phosphate (MurNAc-6-P) etherase
LARARGQCATTATTSAYLFGALCPSRAVGAAVIMPAANSEAMSAHLAEIATQLAPGAHAILLCDTNSG